MRWWRWLAFRLVFYPLTVVIVLTAPVAALAGRRALVGFTHGWFRLHRWAARTILGVRAQFEGAPASRPVLYAAKHESLFETFELTLAIGDPAPVVKRELTRIPVWGWIARRYGVIGVDRDASAGALRHLLRDARAAKAIGRAVLIFPEGTRVLSGERPALRSGFAGLYRALALPVVPVAVDSGRLWPKRGAKTPGVITIRFGEPIPAGLPRAEIEQRVWCAINALND